MLESIHVSWVAVVAVCFVLLTGGEARRANTRRNAMVRDDGNDMDNRKIEDKFRVNQMWHWYQINRDKIDLILTDHEDCAASDRKVTELEKNLKSMGDKLIQLELAMDELTRYQASPIHQGLITATRPTTTVTTTSTTPATTTSTSTTTTSTTTTSTTITTTSSSPSYPTINCPGKGFYQVGLSCFSFTFYRSDTFEGARRYCQVSGGYLAVLNSSQEMVSIINHLNQHVAPSLYPWELVSFFVGGRVRSGAWEWIGTRSEEVDGGMEDDNPVDEGMDKCQDHLVGDCLGLAWDEQRGCQFILSDMDCRTRNRFICEADPLEGEEPSSKQGEAEEPWSKPVHSPLQLPDEHTVQMPY